MTNIESGLNDRKEYPLKSTENDFDIFSLESEHLDLYFIRHFVSEMPPQEVPLSSLESQLKNQSWEDNETNSPAEVLNEYNRLSKDISLVLQEHPRWSERLQRIKQADYSYPILIYKNVVIDGLHRIVHAVMDGKQVIPAHILTALPEGAFFANIPYEQRDKIPNS